MISVVIPTLGTREIELERLFQSLEAQTYQNFEAIVVSQDNHDLVKEILDRYDFPVKHVSLHRKGLSYSRNEGINYTNGNIVTFSDDDCWYEPNAFQEVNDFFENNNVGIVCYQIYDPVKKEYYKEYPTQEQNALRFRDLFRKSSIEIFLKLDVVEKKKVVFDEEFGLGAAYPSGEENIFLHMMYKQGYQISYVPKVVVYHAKPSMDTRLNYKAFLSKGPLFKRIFNTPIGFAMLTFLFIKKYSHLEKPFPFYFDSIKEMIKYKKSRRRP
ncbi:glycosyltransferase family 2 protein [Sutcliffiella rhizosphaerae]|uniref:Glycosyltransferase 2-like domain-containing protein n=1 Tax=Sutcliffiella rhizosphaerae TaxID=2880967 RepID=A0ABN8A8D9_9BACI|nr:glycosyltransferase family 2 protein [Sutcliffiella rhizosphaerae]CAG9621414.1 hypothetical protein BACCIP111883_02187 [Sutcliffiella rhizosphaerae]